MAGATSKSKAKKIEFKEKVADAALSQWSANNATAFIQSNGELSDTAAGARRAVADSDSSERARGIRNNNPEISNTAKLIRG